jgi:hypothetical protein
LHHNVVDIQATLGAVESGDRSKEDRRRAGGFHISAVIDVIMGRLLVIFNTYIYTLHRSSRQAFVHKNRRRLVVDYHTNV